MITLILRILSRIRSNHNQTNSKKNTQMIHIPIIKALYISKKSTYLPYYYYFNRGLTHHRNLMDRYHPGYFGKKGIRVFHLNKNALHCPVINIDKLWSLVSEETRTKYADNKEGVVPVIDVTKAGYFKVLGKGRLPAQPVVVKAKFFSATAERRIKAIGGACVLTA